MFGRNRTQHDPAPLEGKDLILCDLDGVVYRGNIAIDDAPNALMAASENRQLAMLTNNASRTADQVAEHLRELGVSIDADHIVTSPHAAVRILHELVAPGSTVMVVGGEGLTTVLEANGYRVTRSADDQPHAVVQGFARDVGWTHLAEASFALKRDIPWIATNQDWTIPQERGLAPGNGTLVSAVHTAVGKLPTVAGKPEPTMYEVALERFGVSAERTIMIGDRLDTDIQGANAANIDSALVLTGVDRAKQVLAAAPTQRPTVIVESVRDLAKPVPSVRVTTPGPDEWLGECGRERVRLRGGTVSVESAAKDRLNLLRAASGAIWTSNKAIFALRVPSILSDDWLA